MLEHQADGGVPLLHSSPGSQRVWGHAHAEAAGQERAEHAGEAVREELRGVQLFRRLRATGLADRRAPSQKVAESQHCILVIRRFG